MAEYSTWRPCCYCLRLRLPADNDRVSLCQDCHGARHKAAYSARAAVAKAIRQGKLKRPELVYCSECGMRAAWCYDHRDYDKPLDVRPVCRACNTELGLANWTNPFIEQLEITEI